MREICLDMSNGLPEKVDFDQVPKDRRLVRPQDIDSITSSEVFFRVSGKCMESAGIEENGYVLVNLTKFPKPPRYKNKGGDGSFDCCLCRLMSCQEEGSVGVKAYDGKWGSVHCVSTKYTKEHNPHPPFQHALFAKEIYGVVIASYSRDGRLLWKRGPEEFSDHLIEESTIHGEGIGDPIIL